MNKLDEPILYTSLEDNNEFAPWFTEWKDGYIQLPVSQLQSTSCIFDSNAYGNTLDILLRIEKEDVLVFNLKEKYVGMDKTYYFYLSEVYVTKTPNKDDVFAIGFNVKSKVRRTKGVRKRNDYVKQMLFSYEIVCPIIQGL